MRYTSGSEEQAIVAATEMPDTVPLQLKPNLNLKSGMTLIL